MSELIEKKPHSALKLTDRGGCLNRGMIGLISAGKKHRRLHLLPLRNSLLCRFVLGRMARDQRRCPASRPESFAGDAEGVNYTGMMGQAQIVVGREVNQHAPIMLDAGGINGSAYAPLAIKMSLLKPSQVLLYLNLPTQSL